MGSRNQTNYSSIIDAYYALEDSDSENSAGSEEMQMDVSNITQSVPKTSEPAPKKAKKEHPTKWFGAAIEGPSDYKKHNVPLPGNSKMFPCYPCLKDALNGRLPPWCHEVEGLKSQGDRRCWECVAKKQWCEEIPLFVEKIHVWELFKLLQKQAENAELRWDDEPGDMERLRKLFATIRKGIQLSADYTSEDKEYPDTVVTVDTVDTDEIASRQVSPSVSDSSAASIELELAHADMNREIVDLFDRYAEEIAAKVKEMGKEVAELLTRAK